MPYIYDCLACLAPWNIYIYIYLQNVILSLVYFLNAWCRYTPTTNYFGPETVLLAVSDRGLSSPCLDAGAAFMPASGPGGGTATASFATAVDASWALSSALLGSTRYAFNQVRRPRPACPPDIFDEPPDFYETRFL